MMLTPWRAQAADDAEELLRVGLGQAARRLVHDEDPRLVRRARAISITCCSAIEKIAGGALEGKVPVAERLRGPPGRAAATRAGVDPAEARGLEAEEDVLPDGEVGGEVQLLVDHGDAASQRASDGPRGPVGAAVELHRAGVGPCAPLRIFSSVLLPAPFSPIRAWTSPARHLERHRLQRLGRAEGLADPVQAQPRRAASLQVFREGRVDAAPRPSGSSMFSAGHEADAGVDDARRPPRGGARRRRS